MIKYLLIFFLANPLYAKLKEYEVSDLVRKTYSYKTVCKEMGADKHLLMATAKNTFQLDCMGTIVDTLEFCVKHHKGENLLRGRVDRKNKKVICEKGSAVWISINCDKEQSAYCKSKVENCRKIKNIFAYNLEIAHNSIVKEEGVKSLNCYFTQKIPILDLKNEQHQSISL